VGIHVNGFVRGIMKVFEGVKMVIKGFIIAVVD
jgi:hypothetical protein